MEVTIEITNYCPNNCSYCSTNAVDDENKALYLSVEDVTEFLLDLTITKRVQIDRINISGGEPLAHPRFFWIMARCRTHCDNLWVYTNAIPNLMYNANLIKEVGVEANVCLVPGERVYIPKTADKVHLLQLVPQGRAKDMTPANISVSSNLLPEKGETHGCSNCGHILLQADRKVVDSPCRKCYDK